MSILLLEANSITKSFAGVRALKGVSFDLHAGEVHALVGENGAGKSTLIKIITGAVSPDSGTLTVSGYSPRHMDPGTSRALGIAAIYQQPSLFPHLTVSENIALTLETGGPWRRVNWLARTRNAVQLLDRMGAAIDPDRAVETLSMSEQQIVEVAKAIGADAKILIMDEPTASLTNREVDRLFSIVGALRNEGVGIVYISHRLDEVFAVADRISVLRDGEIVATRETAQVSRPELIHLMVGPAYARDSSQASFGEVTPKRGAVAQREGGRELAAVFPKRTVTTRPMALEVRHLSNRAAGLRDISLEIRSGEILGIAGLVGSGRTELAETLFGLRSFDEGEIRVRGVTQRIKSPRDAIRAGLGYVPEDRRQHGVVMDMSIAANTSLANLKMVSRRGLIDPVAERDTAERFLRQLRIKAPSVAADVGSLSGGNQQKVALARWLSIDPAILILDEPTQGVDVGSKAEIHEIMEKLAERGVAIVMISSELPEILAMSDRIAVMRAGTVAGVLDRNQASQQRILALALSESAADQARLLAEGRSASTGAQGAPEAGGSA